MNTFLVLFLNLMTSEVLRMKVSVQIGKQKKIGFTNALLSILEGI